MEYSVVKEEIRKQNVSINHISTKLMFTYPLTKGLPPKVFTDHVERMGILGCHH